uniref:Uncharacterized protein n=1 Tax=Brassica oleracea var. oleracea TaxID=109376 RepID=A0A0D3BYY9_BRAOL
MTVSVTMSRNLHARTSVFSIWQQRNSHASPSSPTSIPRMLYGFSPVNLLLWNFQVLLCLFLV